MTAPSHAELLAAVRLSLVVGVGPRLQQSLLEAFRTPREIFDASEQQLLSVAGIGRKIARAILAAGVSDAAERELENCRAKGVEIRLRDGEGYPRSLAEIPDPPAVLYTRGELLPQDELAVAIVGSRRCSLYGRQQAERLAAGLARAGLTIVSGLARGIDAAAHRGALDAGCRTIAVMATGLSNVYPPEHVELSESVVDCGALVSESPLGQSPLAGLFPQRNRIISGLSLGVIIVEAARRSGALHTARHAMEQGREVFAVPGRIDNISSQGCHDLIRDGVTLIRGVDDVLDQLGPLIEPARTPAGEVHSPRELTLNDQEKTVIAHVTIDPVHSDEILRNCGLDASRALSTITVLEMKRLIQRLPGGYLVRRPQ